MNYQNIIEKNGKKDDRKGCRSSFFHVVSAATSVAVLVLFSHVNSIYDQHIDVGTHEAMKSIFCGIDNSSPRTLNEVLTKAGRDVIL